MEKFQRYLELRVQVLQRELEACDKLLAYDNTNEEALVNYKSKTKARLSEIEMAIEYWDFMHRA